MTSWALALMQREGHQIFSRLDQSVLPESDDEDTIGQMQTVGRSTEQPAWTLKHVTNGNKNKNSNVSKGSAPGKKRLKRRDD